MDGTPSAAGSKRRREDDADVGDASHHMEEAGQGPDAAAGGAPAAAGPPGDAPSHDPAGLPLLPLVIKPEQGAAAATAGPAAIDPSAAAAAAAAVASATAGLSPEASLALTLGLPPELASADAMAAMQNALSALITDPNAAAAAAAVMTDPNNPMQGQMLAQLMQLQGMAGAGSDPNASFSALVAAAVNMAALETVPPGGLPGAGGLPQGFPMLTDPSLLQGGQMMQGMGMDMHGMVTAKGRGRPRKSGPEGTPQPPSGHWMRRFHELAYTADKSLLDNSKMSNAIISVQVQWANMPEEYKPYLSQQPATVDVPNMSTVSYLKRAICRALGGALYPEVLRLSSTLEEVTDQPEDQLLSALGINHNSILLMEATCHDIPNFGQAPASQVQRMSSALVPSSGFTPGGTSSRVGTKERFTLTEMYSLVEGMELHGLKWAKIHKEFKDLENKTQGDLKDKWRNWQRNVANNWTTARVYMPEELKQRIEKLVNDYHLQNPNAGGMDSDRMMAGAGGGGGGGGGGGVDPNDPHAQFPTDPHAALAAMAGSLGFDPADLATIDPGMLQTLSAMAASQQMYQGLDPATMALGQLAPEQVQLLEQQLAAAAAAAAGVQLPGGALPGAEGAVPQHMMEAAAAAAAAAMQGGDQGAAAAGQEAPQQGF